jgi:two-component system chemotaxis sensor kinase CheA
VSDGPGAIDVQRFLRIFLEEASDHLGTLESGLLRLEETPDDREVMDNVFRAAHSVKGGSSTFGLGEVARLTHAMESLLDRMRTGVEALTPALTSLLLRATDELKAMLAGAQEGRATIGATADIMAELEQALGAAVSATGAGGDKAGDKAINKAVAAAPALTEYEIRFRPAADVYRAGSDPLLVLRELGDMGEILSTELDPAALVPLADLDPERSYLAWTIRLRTAQTATQLRDVFMFVEDGSDIEITSLAAGVPPDAIKPAATVARPEAEVSEPRSRTPGKVDASSIRVSVDKVDKLINLVGELVIAQSMVSQSVKDFSIEKLTRLQESVVEMERNIRELQERVMAVRMVPISNVFSRVPRLVRDLAGTLGKKATVQIFGGETEIDKSVIEQIGDPLTHLVRNAVDHGIETPAVRLAAGKPEQGTVKLSAFHQGGSVVIHIEDDGRGLDAEKVRKKAVAQGLIAPDAELSPEALRELIFRPGFSTADQVTDVSGRGVGMDVVRTNIEALNGTISLDSEPGRGTLFRISLPLTLAIIDGLCVGVGSEVYVVPLVSIVESFRPRPGEIKTIAGKGEVVVVRGKVLPVLRLRRLLSVGGRADSETVPLIVIIEHQGATVGLLVDGVLGQAQVVIKSLEAHYRRVEGIMGATIMGDGRVALILDVQGLTRLGHGSRGGTPAATVERRTEA